MPPSDRPIFKKLVVALVALRAMALAVSAFLPLSLPGIWRQTDTLGVAMRYWMRWTVEGERGASALLPAVLNSGDTSGINAMELPLLNLLFAPAFAFGPAAGKVIAMLGVLLLVHGLLYLNYRVWKPHRETLGVDSFGFLLMAVATFSSGWTGKFIPDLVSVLLVLLGVGLSWSRTRPAASGALCAIGILMKPTSVVTLLLFLSHPRPVERARANLGWGVASVAAGVAYYTAGIGWILRYQGGPRLFMTGFHPFAQSLVSFFADVHDWVNMWMYRPFFDLGLIVVLPLSILAWVKRPPGFERFRALWATLFAQYFVIAGLAGPHGFGHDYYFLGLAPTSALLLWWLISRPWPKWVLAVVFGGILVPTIELSTMDLKYAYKGAYRDQLELASACREIREGHPEAPWRQGFVFRASGEEYPALGLCFGERQGSQAARYGFFWNGSVPPDCRPREVTKLVTFADCGK